MNNTSSNTQRCSIKNLFLKISQYSQENISVGVSFNKHLRWLLLLEPEFTSANSDLLCEQFITTILNETMYCYKTSFKIKEALLQKTRDHSDLLLKIKKTWVFVSVEIKCLLRFSQLISPKFQFPSILSFLVLMLKRYIKNLYPEGATRGVL